MNDKDTALRAALEPFHVSRSSNGTTTWFSARDPASGVSIPAKDRADAYALVSSLNRAVQHHAAMAARAALAQAPGGEGEAGKLTQRPEWLEPEPEMSPEQKAAEIARIKNELLAAMSPAPALSTPAPDAGQVEAVAQLWWDRLRERLRGHRGRRIMPAWDDALPEERALYCADATAILTHLSASPARAEVQATEAQADKAVAILERLMDGARNSNQLSENQVVKAARALGYEI